MAFSKRANVKFSKAFKMVLPLSIWLLDEITLKRKSELRNQTAERVNYSQRIIRGEIFRVKMREIV